MTDADSELRTMQAGLARLLAIEDIKALKARYFRLLDARDWDGWATLFTADCRISCLPDPAAVIVGPADFVAFVRAGISPGVSVHHGHMPEIDVIDADHAEGIWAMADIVRTADEATNQLDLSGAGHYHERYERGVDGAWRIASLRLTRLLVDVRSRHSADAATAGWTEPTPAAHHDPSAGQGGTTP